MRCDLLRPGAAASALVIAKRPRSEPPPWPSRSGSRRRLPCWLGSGSTPATLSSAAPPANPLATTRTRICVSHFGSSTTTRKEFTEPVALSSTQPTNRPLPRRALRLSFDLDALRARCTQEAKRSAGVLQARNRPDLRKVRTFSCSWSLRFVAYARTADRWECRRLLERRHADLDQRRMNLPA
jgi:hypothetical protein